MDLLREKNFLPDWGPFLLKDGVQPEELVLTLDGNPVAAEPSPGDIEAIGDIEVPAEAEVKANPPVPFASGEASEKRMGY